MATILVSWSTKKTTSVIIVLAGVQVLPAVFLKSMQQFLNFSKSLHHLIKVWKICHNTVGIIFCLKVTQLEVCIPANGKLINVLAI